MKTAYQIKNNLPFFYIKADEELAVQVVNLFSSLHHTFLYERSSRVGDVVSGDLHISCESNRCDVAYELLEFKNQQIALIYLPFECYRFRDNRSKNLFIDIVNQELEISKEDRPLYSHLYDQLKYLLDELLIDPD